MTWKVLKPVAVALLLVFLLSAGFQQVKAAPRTASVIETTALTMTPHHAATHNIPNTFDCTYVNYNPCSGWFVSGMGNPINGWWYTVNGFGCCNTNYGQGGPENWQYGQSGGWSDRLQWATQNDYNGYVWQYANIWIWIGTEDATACAYGWVQDATGAKYGFWLPEGANSGWYQLWGPDYGGGYTTNTTGGGVFVSLTNQINSSQCGSRNGGNLVAGSKIDYELYGYPVGW